MGQAARHGRCLGILVGQEPCAPDRLEFSWATDLFIYPNISTTLFTRHPELVEGGERVIETYSAYFDSAQHDAVWVRIQHDADFKYIQL